MFIRQMVPYITNSIKNRDMKDIKKEEIMKQKILGKSCLAIAAAALTFTGASTVHADEVTGGNKEQREEALIEQTQDTDLLDSSKSVYSDILDEDFNAAVQSAVAGMSAGETLDISFDSSRPILSKKSLEAIKAKGTVTEIYDVSSESTKTKSTRMPGIVTIKQVTNTSSDFNPLVTANANTAAADKLKNAGVKHFFTVSTSGEAGTKLPGTTEIFAYAMCNMGDFDLNNDDDLYGYYYQESDGRFVELGEDDYYVNYEERDNGTVRTAYTLYNCTLHGTYVFTEGEIPSSALASGYTGLSNSSGTWYYYKNGAVDKSYTGLCKYNGSWWYVKNGKIDFSATTLCKYNGSWWYVQGGRVNFNAVTLCKYNGSWWYVQGGRVNFNAVTLCKYNGSWFYVSGGRVRFGATGLCKYNGSWFYVQGGKVNFGATTLCKYNGNWFYVQGGVVKFKTTLCKYNGTWWYVKNGVLNTSTTLCKYNNTWFAVSGGKVAWGYTGNMKYNGGTFKVVNGIVRF